MMYNFLFPHYLLTNSCWITIIIYIIHNNNKNYNYNFYHQYANCIIAVFTIPTKRNRNNQSICTVVFDSCNREVAPLCRGIFAKRMKLIMRVFTTYDETDSRAYTHTHTYSDIHCCSHEHSMLSASLGLKSECMDRCG